MLETLHIQNYALIGEAAIEFAPGFNALTGETGAGKSILIGALNLALGARASSEAVRQGAKQLRVDAVFRIAAPSRRLRTLLKENDLELEDGELFISRSVTAEGRSRARVCGAPVPIGALAAIGDELVDLHGQHEHQSLLRVERQLDLLDAYAGAEQDASAVGDAVAEIRRIEARLGELAQDDRERNRRLEFLRFEVAEIDAAGLDAGEEEELRTRQRQVANAERLTALATQAYALLYEAEGTAANDTLSQALQDVEDLSEIDPELRPLAEQLRSAQTQVEAIAEELLSYSGRMEYEPGELDTLNERLSLIADLKRKYGEDVPAILAYRHRAAAELEELDHRDARLAELQEERAERRAAAEARATALTKKRRAAAQQLEKRVTAALQDLGMQAGAFVVRLTPTELGSRGADHAEFLLAANPGETPRPLKSVASGGEISRVMLALKTVFASADKIPTLVFDEIDAGVGGAVAVKVAERLRELAASHQVICITHIAQIAAAAGGHHRVAKRVAHGRTETGVERLTPDERKEELARLLDGSVSEVSLRHAEALLEQQQPTV
jgi:DNA repair protein RecN (Recombination protein N)